MDFILSSSHKTCLRFTPYICHNSSTIFPAFCDECFSISNGHWVGITIVTMGKTVSMCGILQLWCWAAGIQFHDGSSSVGQVITDQLFGCWSINPPMAGSQNRLGCFKDFLTPAMADTWSVLSQPPPHIDLIRINILIDSPERIPA